MNEQLEVQVEEVVIRTGIAAGDQVMGSGGATSGPDNDRGGGTIGSGT
jgi:hypothetical protein